VKRFVPLFSLHLWKQNDGTHWLYLVLSYFTCQNIIQ